jgi:hypothetical protein
LADCTPRIPRAHLISLLAVCLLALALWPAGSARGDGDPASDVLASQPLFLPQDASTSGEQQAQLGALVSAAARNGYPLRVAVVASSSDLGSVTALWGQPANYSRFLSEELSLVYRGPVLVVMPGGYGLSREGRTLSAGSVAGGGLASAALTSIRRLAAAAGHALPASAATLPPGSGSTDVVALLVLAAGAALIALTWTASLRARPLRDGLL